jgi:hypothetical protein
MVTQVSKSHQAETHVTGKIDLKPWFPPPNMIQSEWAIMVSELFSHLFNFSPFFTSDFSFFLKAILQISKISKSLADPSSRVAP